MNKGLFMDNQLYKYSLLLCMLLMSPINAYQKVEHREPADLCEAIEQNKPYAYGHFVQNQDINTCNNVHNLGNNDRIAGMLLGFLMLPLAPLIWYGTLRESPETPLSTAVWNLRSDMFNDLLRRGVDVNKQDSLGYTPLHWACSALTSQSSYLSFVKKLLNHGATASLNIKDNKGRIPLHWACIKGNYEIADALIVSGSPIYSYDKDGKTPLDYRRENEIKHAH